MFHFGSSIGTHSINDSTGKSSGVIVIWEWSKIKDIPIILFLKNHFIFLSIKSSPTRRSDKCFYYAPSQNWKKFEPAQGFIASNHFNAKQSVVSFKGTFYVMSLNIGDSWIRKELKESPLINLFVKLTIVNKFFVLFW